MEKEVLFCDFLRDNNKELYVSKLNRVRRKL